ncbi:MULTISPECIES: DUF488 domain-containing protein [unclassified Sphingobium]|uniref:DUF488 family protein n=1 Tax=Sphingobium TaxID=165695 RepID=UPI0015EBE397
MIFSIGYSNRSLCEFLYEVERRCITQLWDVRSSPWSRNTHFNASQIERWACKAGIMYRREGEILGGMRDVCLRDPRYLEALVRLLDASGREHIAIMCAEGDPEHCHRTWDIAASLLVRWGVVVKSVRRDGRNEDSTSSLARVRKRHFDPAIRDAVSRVLRGDLI